MRASIFFDEPKLLREAVPNDLFVVHDPSLNECVCTCVIDTDGELDANLEEESQAIVVVACRVHKGEIGFQPTGQIHVLLPVTWITFVEPIEPFAFRERTQDVAPAPAASAFTTCTRCPSTGAEVHPRPTE